MGTQSRPVSRHDPPPDQGGGEEEGLTEKVLLGLGVGAGLCGDLDSDPLETTETATSVSGFSAF